ncbi:MAG: preprotein translocase subunit SecG [Odoribacteraceae bacterium]|jgi:preprotein translocase subunit SecG|nr:preprotein translocase subunit SecG [Odoribacteraceae bacterium]
MYTVVSILIIIVSILLILLVLVQNSKGGGLASSFASSNQIMGVRKTTDFLEKATWTLAGTLFVLCIVAAMFIPKGEQGSGSVLDGQIGNMQTPAQTVPSFPTQGLGGDNIPLPIQEEGN